MKEPVDHILRPLLPWRSDDGAITECGYDASKVKAVTRKEFFQRLKEYGQQRTAMLMCMTCSDTAQRWCAWEEDPRQALGREVTWEGGYYRARSARGERLKDELLTIADLIDLHRAEFDALLAHRRERQRWLEMKSAAKGKPIVPQHRL